MRLFPAAALACASLFAQPYDIVIANGRVVDPASNTDAVRNIGIRGRSIAALSETALEGKVTVDARGHVVAPGFIDMHSHGQDEENYRYKARDGVTTALEMEVGVSPVASWYAARQGRALVNFGATVGHIPIRMSVMKDSGEFLPRDRAVATRATSDDLARIKGLVRQGIQEGALGIGMGIAYVPAASRAEILELFQLAAEMRRGVFVHVRSAGAIEPGGFADSLQEMIANSVITRAPVQIVHITSMALAHTPKALEMINAARRAGVDISVEAYPYTASQTGIDSAIYSGDWQERLGISYKDLQWALTGERLTRESFEKYRKTGGSVIAHSIPEAAAQAALRDPLVMVASDGLLRDAKGHPRGAGTFARVLGRYVREQKILTLQDAIRRMSLMPAQRLEAVAPAMKNKGRIAVGADADLIVFDPDKVIDRATFEKPAEFSTGIRDVLVNGVFVVRGEKLLEGVKPGEAIRASN
ncbi:MAG: amidohydrolase family protein [Bryobacteraceae bacterium]|nr:amidohydrolase family protein [Bryobacteraceae bacterium]